MDTKNCITYLLEGDNQDEIKIFISADRSTDIQNSLSGSILNVDVQSEVRTVQWYVEIFIPGNKFFNSSNFSWLMLTWNILKLKRLF